MKLDPMKIEVLIPAKLSLIATNKLTVRKKNVTVSLTLVEKIGSPEYVRLYVDKSAKLFFIVPCKKDSEGARRFLNPKSKSKTVIFQSAKLSTELSNVGGFSLEKKAYQFEAEDVEGRTKALGFDLSNFEKNKSI